MECDDDIIILHYSITVQTFCFVYESFLLNSKHLFELVSWLWFYFLYYRTLVRVCVEYVKVLEVLCYIVQTALKSSIKDVLIPRPLSMYL